MQHVGSSSLSRGHSLHWECGVLATGHREVPNATVFITVTKIIKEPENVAGKILRKEIEYKMMCVV